MIIVINKKFYKGPCFIATAVYEDYNHPQVMVLRTFRDKYLLTNNLGTQFVNLYYKYRLRALTGTAAVINTYTMEYQS